jgi:hypothetical protein
MKYHGKLSAVFQTFGNSNNPYFCPGVLLVSKRTTSKEYSRK